MKTAEEWYKENNISGECFVLLTRSNIKDVQLDAFKAGAEWAGRIAINVCVTNRDAILTAAEQLKEIPR